MNTPVGEGIGDGVSNHLLNMQDGNGADGDYNMKNTVSISPDTAADGNFDSVPGPGNELLDKMMDDGDILHESVTAWGHTVNLYSNGLAQMSSNFEKDKEELAWANARLNALEMAVVLLQATLTLEQVRLGFIEPSMTLGHWGINTDELGKLAAAIATFTDEVGQL